MNRLIGICSLEGLLPKYRNTSIGLCCNTTTSAGRRRNTQRRNCWWGYAWTIATNSGCRTILPNVLRAGAANLRYSEFKVSYAIAVGGVKHIALIGHTQCGMVNLMARRMRFVRGLVEIAGWEPESAAVHFLHFTPQFEIGDEIDFALSETKRLRQRYSGVQVAPLLYRVEDHLLYAIEED